MAIYYVRPDGNNNNDGLGPTPDRAWQTLTKAANTVVAGDTVIIAPGTYVERLEPVNAGTATAFIRWLGDESGEVFGVSPGDIIIQSPGDSDCIYLSKPYHEIGFIRVRPQSDRGGISCVPDASGHIVLHDIKAIDFFGSQVPYSNILGCSGSTGTYNIYYITRAYSTIPHRFLLSHRDVHLRQALVLNAVGNNESNGVWSVAYPTSDCQSVLYMQDCAFVGYSNRSAHYFSATAVYGRRIYFANSSYTPILGRRILAPCTSLTYQSCTFADISASYLASCGYTDYPALLYVYNCAIISAPTDTTGFSAVSVHRMESLSEPHEYDLRFPNLYFLERANPITGKANIRIPVLKWGRFFMEVPVSRGDRQITIKIKKSWTGTPVKVLVNRAIEQTLTDDTSLQTLTFTFTAPLNMYVPVEVWAKASDYTERSVWITEIAID